MRRLQALYLAIELFSQPGWTRPTNQNVGFDLTYVLDVEIGGNYYIDLAVGEPPQHQRLVVDTSSADIALHSTADSAYLAACAAQTQVETCFSIYDNTSSHSYREVGPGTYGSVLAGEPGKGSYISDTVTFGPAVIKNQVMASTWNNSLPYGLFGLAPPKDEYGAALGTFKRYPILLSNLFSDNIISSPSFGLWFDPAAQDPQVSRGHIDFGVIDETLFSGKPVTLPVVTNRTTALDSDPWNWNVALGSVAMASQPDDNAIVGRTVSCVVNSGGTFFSFNNASYHKLAEKFPLAVANQTFPGLTFYQIPCEERYNSRNDIIFSLIDPRDPAIHFDFTVPSHQVIWPANLVLSQADPEMCAINALAWEEVFAGSALVQKYECMIGSAALKSVYSVFDLNNLQISFATSLPRTGSPKYSSIPPGGLTAMYA